MKKRILSLALALTLILGLTGCSCKHEWRDATCTTPATCAKCGEVAGSPLGHNWKDATCTQPETCSVCRATNGEPLGHQWLAATCTTSETCSVCGETQGDAPVGHILDEDGYCTVCHELIGIPLTMENYTQYLKFSKSSERIVVSNTSRGYLPYAEWTMSVTPNSHYTYHNVNINWTFTTTRTYDWENLTWKRNLTESGFWHEDPDQALSLYQMAKYTYVTESSAQYIATPNYQFSIVDITGYVLPVETDAQES